MIDGDKYWEELRCDEEWTDFDSEVLEGFLLSKTGRKVMGAIESQALVAEKGFCELDFAEPKSNFAATEIKAKMAAQRDCIYLMLTLASQREKDNA